MYYDAHRKVKNDMMYTCEVPVLSNDPLTVHFEDYYFSLISEYLLDIVLFVLRSM